jgi:ribonucleoside-diphosphate reductase alpha chain
MTVRRHLQNRRASTTFDFEVGGLRYIATASRFDDGNPAEIFISSHRAGSPAGIMASDAAIAASLALQHGCPVEVLRRALSRHSHGRGSGPVGGGAWSRCEFHERLRHRIAVRSPERTRLLLVSRLRAGRRAGNFPAKQER